MKKFLFPLSIIVIAFSGFKNSNSTITRSAITFKIKNIGIGVSGSFSGLRADVDFKPADLPSSHIEASVDASTINTGISGRDNHLKSEDYFDVARYPRITMKSVSFKHREGSQYAGMFNLTIRDKTKLMEVPFELTEKDGVIDFKGSFKLNRLDFGVGKNSFILSNEVTVNIDAESKD